MESKKISSEGVDDLQDDDIKEEIICSTNLFPGSAFILDGSDDSIKKRLMNQDEKDIGSHNKEEIFTRRLKF